MRNCVNLQGLDIHIFNLPEEIYRTIFSYLDAEDLHLNLRNTCQQLRDYVTNYVEWEQTAIMFFQGLVLYHPPIEAVHMIKFASRKPIVYTKTTFPEVPNLGDSTRLVFAATIQKRIVIVVD